MVGWYARFIPALADLKLPLTTLLKKDVKWQWGTEQQEAFEALRVKLTQAPVLARPHQNRPYILQTDASQNALGAVLCQELGGEEHPIAYASRTLSKAELNYTVTEKECLAVLWAVEKFRGYLLGEKFQVITDHSSLKWLNTLKEPTGRLARWATALQAYDMTIIHRKGALHKVPDTLSRIPQDEQPLAAIGTLERAGWYKRQMEKIRRNTESFPDWKVENGHLYKQCPDPLIDPLCPDLDKWKLVVPGRNRERVLFECHNATTDGHLGAEKTLQRVR